MEKLVALVLFSVLSTVAAITCPPNYSVVGNGCYIFFNNVFVSYLDARTVCQDFGGDLAVLESCDDHKDVYNYIRENEMDADVGYWVGASDVLIEGQFKWTDGSEIPSGAPWWGRSSAYYNGTSFVEEPQMDEDNCLAMSATDGYYLHNELCELEQGYAPLCQTSVDIDGNCAPPYEKINGQCFQFLNTLNENFEDSRTICQSSNGDLAIFNDCGTFGAVIRHITNLGHDVVSGFWVGATRGTLPGRFVWINGDVVEQGTPFFGREGEGPLQPDGGMHENCAALSSQDGYYLVDEYCGQETLSPLCEAPPTL